MLFASLLSICIIFVASSELRVKDSNNNICTSCTKTATSSKTSYCKLSLDGTNSFDWDDHDNITFIDNYTNQLCKLTSFHEHPKFAYSVSQSSSVEKQKHKPLQVLMIGDSFDLHMCFHLKKEYPSKIHHFPTNCYTSSALNIDFYRIYGIIGKNISHLIKNIRMNHTSEQDIIVFTSIVWDIKNSHDQWCQKHKISKTIHNHHQLSNSTTGNNNSDYTNTITPLQVKCYCEYNIMDTNTDCLLSYNGVQKFSSQRLPWCGNDLFYEWKIKFMETIQILQKTFPKALILLRNQPFAASITFGGEICLGLFNQAIHRISTIECTKNQHNNDDEAKDLNRKLNNKQYQQPRLLDTHSLLLQGIHHLGTFGGAATDPKHQKKDYLHYFEAARHWTNYVINSILSLNMNHIPNISKCFPY